MTLSKKEARHIILSSHSMLYENGAGKTGLVEVVNRLGYLQFDTIHLFMRAHHHTLWNRLKDYRPEWLDEAQKVDRNLFEYWSHAASVIPMEHFRFALPRMKRIEKDGKFWFDKIPDVSEKVLEVITGEGAKRARDFKDDGHRGSWWDWKPAKIALQYLQMAGTLSVSHREGFEKVYDLTERIVPSSIDTSMPSEEESAEYLIITRLRAEGLLSLGGITYLRQDGTAGVKKKLAEFLEEGQVFKAEIENAGVYYGLTDPLTGVGGGFDNQGTRKPKVKILSPFDNLVIIRDRLERIFDFKLYLECYLPAEKRRFGYFAQPILYGTEFVGKIDFKIAGKTAIVRNIELERRKGLTESFRREWKNIMKARGVEETLFAEKTGDKMKLFAAG
ncbi:MAG: YcaQ family DNA glycosylase [Spirochaetales bacterium]|nr:YcaQ family DNA glycosylase [Spirochaetales bacterium]